MSTETLIKENSKNIKLDPRGSENVLPDPLGLDFVFFKFSLINVSVLMYNL